MRIADIKYNDSVDGEGVCVSLWVQGCDHACPNCHNPETWDFKGGIEKPIKDIIKELLSALQKNGLQRNFSVLGGEPLHNKNVYNVAEIISTVRTVYPNIKIFLWTGYNLEELDRKNKAINCILNNIDILIDGPYVEKERDITLHLRGSRNQKIREKGIDF
jgi:anaerobic ribonucleoside-triphosphate reductase activating protein